MQKTLTADDILRSAKDLLNFEIASATAHREGKAPSAVKICGLSAMASGSVRLPKSADPVSDKGGSVLAFQDQTAKTGD